ncbi:hypothetical protein ACLKA7_014812 [Drosophila subpalustris]
MYEMDEVCRFCTLSCTTLENIFDERERMDNEPLLISILQYCTNCEVSECDSLPQNICGPCKSAAKNAFAFKLRCEQSEKYFKDLLIACDQKPDIDELITGDSCSSENTFVKEGIKPKPAVAGIPLMLLVWCAQLTNDVTTPCSNGGGDWPCLNYLPHYCLHGYFPD